MKKFFPLCLLLIVALVWTLSVAGNFDRVPTANSSQQTIDKSQNLDAVQVDEMTPDKADRIRADKDARYEELLRSLAGEEVSSENAVEYPSNALTNYGGEAEEEYLYGPVTIAENSLPGSEFRMRELKADGVIDADERAEYEQLLADQPVVELPVPLNIVSESEPNDDCSTADPMACGDTVWCATQTTGQDDHDWFTFTLDGTNPSWEVVIETHPTSGACDPASSDTYLELWTGDCQAFITSDDDGGVGWFSLITITLPPGSYAIHEDNTIWNSDGSYHLSVLCAADTCYGQEPPNDLCSNVTPTVLTMDVPQVFNGTSACATIDCGLLGNPHSWEAFTTTQPSNLSIQYCGSLYNGGPWGNGYIVLDDCPCVAHTYADSWEFVTCVDGNVTIYWDNLPAGTYYYPMIWDPANNAGGAYTISVLATTIVPCDVVCPTNAIIEGEPPCSTDYVDNYNGGCNSSPNVFQYINCGDTVCGETGTYLYQGGNYRDTDWFEFTTTTTNDITITGVAEVDFLMFLIDAGSGTCTDYSIMQSGTGDPCSTVTVTVPAVPPGTYYAWAGPSVFTGWPCGSEYWLTVQCVEPIGRCCYNNDLDCADITESACIALGGDWVFGLNCTDNPCICPEDQVVIEIMTDDYPSETTWDLVDQYSTVIATGGPYGNANSLYVHEICVEDTACMIFTIYDAYGDGICCAWGNGYYNVYLNGNLEGTGGDFGDFESVGPFGTGCGVVIGRCCYGDPYNPSCADNEQTDCAALGGQWTFGLNCTDNPCPAIPANDSCSGAITVAVPSSTPGSTTLATPDTLDCGTYQYANSVWYKVVGTGNTITATTCDAGSNYDTKLQVWCNTCSDLICVDGNDDMGSTNCSYSGLLSAVTWCSEQGTEYLILVGGYSSYSGDFVLNVSDDGTPCSTPPNCLPPIGRCCYNNDQDCADITADACAALGGYWNELLNCVDNPCACPTGQDKIMLDLWTDSYPGEVSWEIYERTTGLVAAGGPYPDPNTNYVEEVCVDQGGCYDWYIYDSFGDGGGPYDLYYAGNLVHSSDGNYGLGEAVYDIGNSGCGQPSGACCFADGSCADMTEDDCIAQGGVSWRIYESCANVECPVVMLCDSTALWHNGFPIGYARASQCDPEYPMAAEMADDFMLAGPDPVTVGWVIAWFDHWNGNVNGPADYLGLNVTVYADDPNSLPYHAPGGKPIHGDTTCAHTEIIPGGVVYTTEVAQGDFGYFEDSGYWRIQIPIDVTLDPDITYWLAVEPIMLFSQAGQSGWVDGDLFQGYTAVQIFELLGTLVWTPQDPAVDLAFCLLAPSGPSGCDYIVGDVNGSNNYNGLDITYGVAFFKGGPAPLCDPNCPPCAGWHYCGDVNGSCNYNGLDITYGVAYFKGGPAPIPCDDCPPSGDITGEYQAPEMPQVIKSKTVNQNGSGLK